MKNPKHTIAAIILAGGQGRRFNYEDKGLVRWQGKTLVEHVIARIEHQVSHIIISANRNEEQYRTFGYTLCSDKLTGFQGPLAGIQAALPHTDSSLVLVCPCDTVFLPTDLVNVLKSNLNKHAADVAYPLSGQRAHYLPVLLKTSLLEKLNAYLCEKDRSMKGWYKTLKAAEVRFDDAQYGFSNFNYPKDLPN